MKTTAKLFSTLLLVILVQFTVSAKPIKNEQTDINKLRRHLISQIAFPSQVKNADGQQVTVQFEINKDFKPEICNVETDNPEIEKFIRAEFETMQLPAAYSKINEPYTIKIKFTQHKNS